MPQTATIPEPYGSYNFHIEIDGILIAAFHEASGFESTIDVIEHREGGENTSLRKLPGLTKYSNIVLKRGITDDTQLYDWHMKAVRGQVERRNGSIVLLDQAANEVRRWNFIRAWPVKWTGPSLNAETSDVSIETLELAHEGLERAKNSS